MCNSTTASSVPSTQKFEHREPLLPSQFKRPMARAIVADGDIKTARRVEYCSTSWVNHLLPFNKIIKENKNPCHEYTLCQNCAELRSIELVKHFTPLQSLCPEQFTYLVTSLDHANEIEKILRHRRLGKIILLGNPGWDRNRKMLVTRFAWFAPAYSMPYIVVQALRQADPSLHVEVRGSSRYLDTLREIFTPYLPDTSADRLILKRMDRKVIFVGATRSTRKKLSDITPKPLSDNNSSDKSDSYPCHIKGCLAHTDMYFVGTPESELVYTYHAPPPKAKAV